MQHIVIVNYQHNCSSSRVSFSELQLLRDTAGELTVNSEHDFAKSVAFGK